MVKLISSISLSLKAALIIVLDTWLRHWGSAAQTPKSALLTAIQETPSSEMENIFLNPVCIRNGRHLSASNAML